MNRRAAVALVVSGSIAFVVAAGVQADRDSMVADEGVYLSSGLAAWEDRDLYLNPEHPPLARLLAAFPLQLAGVDAPSTPAARSGHWFEYADDFWTTQRAEGTADRALRAGRTVAVLEALLVGVLLAVIGHRWFSPAAGAAAALVWWSSAVALGLGHVVTVDVPMVLAVLGVVMAADRWFRLRGDRQLVLVGVALGLALSVRHSGLLVTPAVLGVLVAGGRDWWERLRLVTIPGLVALGTVWAVYRGFDPGGPPDEVAQRLSHLVDAGRQSGLGRLATSLPWPPEHRAGLGYLVATDRPGPGFVAGVAWEGRNVWYWPVVLLITSPPAVLAAFVMSVPGWLALRRIHRERALLVAALAGAVLLGAVPAQRIVGARYLLPLVVLAVLVGVGGWWELLRGGRWRIAGVAVLVLQVGLVAAHWPATLGYTNPPFRPAEQWVADSDLDWGQDLERAGRLVETLEKPVYGEFFAGRGAQQPSVVDLDDWPVEGPVGWVLASASSLTVYRADELAWLRAYCAVDTVGSTIMVYRFDRPPDLSPGPDRPVDRCRGAAVSRRSTSG